MRGQVEEGEGEQRESDAAMLTALLSILNFLTTVCTAPNPKPQTLTRDPLNLDQPLTLNPRP